MDVKDFKKRTSYLAGFMGAGIGIAVASNQPIIALVTITIGVIYKIILRKQVQGVLHDEMFFTISEKASRLTLQISLIFFALASLIFIFIGKNVDPNFLIVAYTLSAATCFSMILSIVFFQYYSKQYGLVGEGEE